METCGCHINYGVGKGGNTIVYCPMHAAAPKMYEALQEADKRLERDLAPDHPVMVQIFQALAEAEES